MPGMDAPPPPPPKQRALLFARHAQAVRTGGSLCPAGTSEMWTGYSLLHITGNKRVHGQDLGAPGSCMRRFSTMPYLYCDSKNVCNVAQRTDYSYWLTTDEPMPQDIKFIPATDVAPYISR